MPKGKPRGAAAEPCGWWRVARDAADAIDIDVYEDIGERRDRWTGETAGAGAKAFLETLRAARGKAVNLHVNSGGGSVVDAYAMMTAISEHDGKVTAYVDGLAASAASFLVAAADEVVISSCAWMMIHKATLISWGDSDSLRADADYLDKVDAQIAGIYAKRSGSRTEDEFSAAMAETTWLTAEEAVEWGLADRVVEAVAAAACSTRDEATLASAPPGAEPMLRAGAWGPASPLPPGAAVPGDAGGNMPPDEGEPGAQEPPAARERAVRIGNRLVKVRERDTRLGERNEDA